MWYHRGLFMKPLSKDDKLLVIAPHPDDEVIGCGGLIQRVKKEQGKVFVLFMTVGDTKDFTKKGLSKGADRMSEIEKVSKFLKYDKYHVAFPGDDYQLKLDKLGQLAIMDVIERNSPLAIEKIKPTIVAFPSVNSYNQDHVISAKAAHASLRVSSKDKYFVRTALSYEFPADFWTTGLEPERNVYLPLSKEEWKRKISALKLYKSQWRGFPSSRSERSLTSQAILRGNDCVSEFAEAYYLYRNVIT